MSIKISRYLLITVSIFILSIFLPRYYWMLFDVNIPKKSVLFSPVDKNFVFFEKGKYSDNDGNSLTLNEYEEKLPLRYYRQLIVDKTMPEKIGDWTVDIGELKINRIMFRIKPTFFHKPQIPLFPLFESKSGRVNLEFPEEYFRINNRMEFLHTTSNSINEELTQKFTSELKEAGFQFPASNIYGNPTTRKPFDEGYFVLDNKQSLFHIKMVKGEAVVNTIDLPEGFRVKNIKVSENNLKEFYGIIFGEDNTFYFLGYDNYKLIDMHSELFSYNSDKDVLLILCDVFYRTFIINKDDGMQIFVTDREYNIIDQYSDSWETKYDLKQGVISKTLFPFMINMYSSKNYYSKFHISYANLSVFILNFLLVIFLYLKTIRPGLRKEFAILDYLDLVIVFFTGIYGLISVLIFNYKIKH